MLDLLYRDPAKQKAFAVKSPRRGVKEASLSYRVPETLADASLSLVQIRLHTGRFHQIRCQFAARGFPLAGDGKYGSRVKGCSAALWCRRLTFYDPSDGARLTFQAPPPNVFPWSLFQAASQ